MTIHRRLIPPHEMTVSCLSAVALRHFDRDSPLLGDGWVVGIELGSPVEVLNCAVVRTQLDARHSPLVVGLRVGRVKLYGPAEVPDRSVMPAEIAQRDAPGVVDEGDHRVGG